MLVKHGAGSLQTLIDGMSYAINWKEPHNETISAISLSLGAKEESHDLQQVVQEARSKGIFVIAAAGNDIQNDLDACCYYHDRCLVERIRHNLWLS